MYSRPAYKKLLAVAHAIKHGRIAQHAGWERVAEINLNGYRAQFRITFLRPARHLLNETQVRASEQYWLSL